MKQVHIFVYGRVQGVFYRANTRKKAKELGIKGGVRIEDDVLIKKDGIEILTKAPKDFTEL